MWNQKWGSMIWGVGSQTVPMMNPLHLVLLALALMVVGALLSRHPAARRHLGKAAGLLVLLVPLSAVAVPFTFSNGTVADATQVNQNFASLESRITALEATRTLAFAHVKADGTIDSDSGNITVAKIGAGTYCAGVTGATPRVAVASLDGRMNVGGTVQASVFFASGCPAASSGRRLSRTRPRLLPGGELMLDGYGTPGVTP